MHDNIESRSIQKVEKEELHENFLLQIIRSMTTLFSVTPSFRNVCFKELFITGAKDSAFVASQLGLRFASYESESL